MQTIDELILALQSIKRDLGMSGDTLVFLPGYNDYGVVQPSSLRTLNVRRDEACQVGMEIARKWVADENGITAVLIRRDPTDTP